MARKKVLNKFEQKERKEIRKYKDTDYTEEECLDTISTCWADFMIKQKEKGNSKATIDYYNRFYKKFSKFINEDMKDNVKELPIATLVKLDGFLLVFIKTLGDVNIQTINSYKRAYRAFGMFCQEQGYIQGFECKIKEVEPPIKAVYTDEELKKLLVKPDYKKFEEYRNYVIITLLLSTGARCNTILNIKIDDVDFENNSIIFNTTKSNKVANIPLPKKEMRILKEYIYHYRQEPLCDFLFVTAYDTQMTRGGLTKAIKNYNLKRGVTKTSLHLFRHTFAKKWITSGGNIYSLQRTLTHSDLTMVKRYSNLYSGDVATDIENHSILNQITTKREKRIKMIA